MSIEEHESKGESEGESTGEFGGEFDLAPPESFGVGRPSGGHLLPVATTMGAILADDEPEEALKDFVEPEASLEDWPDELSSAVHEEAVPRPEARLEAETAPEIAPSAAWPRIAVVVVVLGTAAGGFAWWTQQAESPAIETAAAPAVSAVTPDPTPPPTPRHESPGLEAKIALINDVGQMKAAALSERHALLRELEGQGLTGRVNLDLHIALDLLQAEQASRPCQTFADALTLVESGADRAFVRPAVESVEASPKPGAAEKAKDCKGLDARLAKLKREFATQVEGVDPVPPAVPAVDPIDELVASADTKRRKRSSARKKAKKARPSEPAVVQDPTPPPLPAPKAEPATPKSRAGAISTKFDDGLRPPS